MKLENKNKIEKINQLSQDIFGSESNLNSLQQRSSLIDEIDYKSQIRVCELLFNLLIVKNLSEEIDQSFVESFTSRYYEMILEIEKMTKYDDERWRKYGKESLNTLNSQHNQILALIINNSNFLIPLLFNLKSLETEIKTVSTNINKDTKFFVERTLDNFKSDFSNEIKIFHNQTKAESQNLTERYNELISLIETKSKSLEERYNALAISASIKNIENAKDKTKIPLYSFAGIASVALIAVIILLFYSYSNIDSIFEYLDQPQRTDWGIEIKKMYILKSSLISLSVVALFSGIFTYSVKMLKSYLNIRTIYNHKLALLGSFDDLVGKDILNPQERHTVTETLIKQIISGDGIGLIGDNQSSPSIIQSVIEKVSSSTESK
jgi:hypothetical protein